MWKKIKDWFSNSETLAWSRLQVLVGFIATALVAVDPTIITAHIDPKYIPIALVLNGLATEYLRRRRSDL